MKTFKFSSLLGRLPCGSGSLESILGGADLDSPLSNFNALVRSSWGLKLSNFDALVLQCSWGLGLSNFDALVVRCSWGFRLSSLTISV